MILLPTQFCYPFLVLDLGGLGLQDAVAGIAEAVSAAAAAEGLNANVTEAGDEQGN